MIKNNKGITMITLIITIIVILIISGVTIYESVENIKARKIDSLYADLESLEDKVNTYFLNNGTLPIKEEFKGSENFKTVKNVNDNDVYYVIDISLLDGVSLNMKLDFTGDDVYIMNEQTHTVYYPKGLTIDNETYYTLPKLYTEIGSENPISSNVVKLEAEVKLEGRELNAGEFKFMILPEKEPFPENLYATNDINGNITFSPIIFEQEGTYSYLIQQVSNNIISPIGMTYDASVFMIVVEVKEVGEQLIADTTYYDGVRQEVNKIVFYNQYSANTAEIELSGISISPNMGRPIVPGEFWFDIVDDTDTMIGRGTNDSDGNISLPSVEINEPGTYQFKVLQDTVGASGLVMDDSVYTIIVRVTDSGGQLNADIKYYDEKMNEVEKIEFVNKYGEP